MKEKRDLLCFSHQDFDNMCSSLGYSDENLPKDIAFISITCTEDCQKFYLEEEESHWFKHNHPNVLNISFNDISGDTNVWEGHVFYGLQKDQAEEIYRFIENNLGKNFWIHCRAGQSRSQGIVRYILDCYPEYIWITRKENPCITPNYDVTGKLKHIWWENNMIF